MTARKASWKLRARSNGCASGWRGGGRSSLSPGGAGRGGGAPRSRASSGCSPPSMIVPRAAPERARGRPPRPAAAVSPAVLQVWVGGSAQLRAANGSRAARCPRPRPGRRRCGPSRRRSPSPPRRSCGDSDCDRSRGTPARGVPGVEGTEGGRVRLEREVGP